MDILQYFIFDISFDVRSIIEMVRMAILIQDIQNHSTFYFQYLIVK